jgi:hypothetical protein
MKTSDLTHYTLLDGAQHSLGRARDKAAPLQVMRHGPFAGLAERSAR